MAIAKISCARPDRTSTIVVLVFVVMLCGRTGGREKSLQSIIFAVEWDLIDLTLSKFRVVFIRKLLHFVSLELVGFL